MEVLTRVVPASSSSTLAGSAFGFALTFGLGLTNMSTGAEDVAALDADVFVGHSLCQCPNSPHFTHLLFFCARMIRA